MNNKRSRNKIYHFIDIFFLSLPALYIIFCCVSPFFTVSFEFTTDTNYTFLGNFLTTLSSRFEFSIDTFIDWFTDYGNIISNSFIQLFSNFMDNVINFFGIDFSTDPYIWYLIKYYFIYIVCYEFLSLFVNVVLWIPRYFRDWLQRHSSEGV